MDKEIHFTVSDDDEMMMAYRGTWLQFSVQDWKKLSAEILLALKQLGMEV